MGQLKVLICGGGCAGPALAFWLARLGHHVTIVERYPALRATGAQIDLREQGIEVAKRMKLLDIIRSKRVDEAGMAIVDSENKVVGTMMANTSGKGAQTGTSEYEIMRGDLVGILYDSTKKKVEYLFGKTVDSFEQDENHVFVKFSDNSSDKFDILVGADGQGSRIRKAIQPENSPDPYRKLGVHASYWFIPRISTDNNIGTVYHAAEGRMILRRSHSPTESQVYFFLRDESPDASLIHRGSVEQQKEFWTQRFRNAGWHTDRFLEGMKTTENFYSQEIVQVKTDTWHRGRVVLLGDAAHCPSPFTGMGTTTSFVGAYVLAGEISKHSGDIPLAFANYDKVLRPFINESQRIIAPVVKLLLPETRWGVSVLHWIVWFVSLLRIPELAARFSSEERGGWPLPEYPELVIN
ncbi:oxidoreductase [Colletotrichum truncatum]|uniref:Oxidoreductase n=1 Tax=Colletotrichum truncatum TaxID=5467 RepID=A0ACC3ZKG1_COLTU|nr:oxidoreductase [Colletotrichum truncatum]KAF6799999.1 oxidoreductase [Colletotrichum truncatum]